MKKIVISIALISYLAVTTGIVINFHYCMNKLASTELFAMQGKRCGKCGMNLHKSHGCCHDEVKVVKMQEDQKVTAFSSFELPALDAMVIVPSDFIATSFINAPVKGHYNNHSPPLISEQDTYLQNRVFRI